VPFIIDVLGGIDQEISNDLLALDIRQDITLGEITGEISTKENSVEIEQVIPVKLNTLQRSA
jgi:hypothetical protein